MSDNQSEFLPSNDSNQKRKAETLLPRFYRSDSNKKFISGTINQLIQNGTVRRLNGHIGRENSKSTSVSDIFLNEPIKDRKDYQLEPSLVIEDTIGNVTFYKDYLDYINTLDVLGGITNNHARINQQEFYSWEPHIDWDKIVNFAHYYWLPFGPDAITIPGQQQGTISKYTVTLSDEGDNRAYLFTPDGLTRNPALTLYRGQTYSFEINCPNEPFSIKSQRQTGEAYRFLDGIDSYAVENGVITFTVPLECADVLYYVSENTPDTSGIIKIFDIKENTTIDVENEIINKQTYTLRTGLSLSNGMKVNFKGQVTPSLYSEGDFYVEGVGDRIQLIPEKQLEIVAPYTKDYEVTFDDTGYDKLSYNDVKYSPIVKDYISINRASTDRNPWSRYNRWFHESVIEKTAKELGQVPVFDQAQRAKRPIIEFKANLKLFNFGTMPKKDIDLVDDFTGDVFSIIEGALGYNVDGVSLLDGHRILFTGDNDPLVNGKIYRVNFITTHENNSDFGTRRIHLEEEPDTTPNLYDVLLVKTGTKYTAQMLWYNGTQWLVGQTKTTQNQQPLFDLFDEAGISLNDTTKYDGSTFLGNKIFSYKIGTGTKDSELGFALSYKNINNVGDILFNFDLLQNSFSYKILSEVITESTDNKFIKKVTKLGTEYLNGWVTNKLKNVQPIVRIYKNETVEELINGVKTKVALVNNFPIDVYDDITNLDDLLVKVYINGKRLDKNLFHIEDDIAYKIVVLNNDITDMDIVTLRCYSGQFKNANGKYEFPINFQNNPLNNNINDFTLGEVIDHVDSIIDNIQTFEGSYPGIGNLRDLSDISSCGTKFVQHSGSINLSLYHLTNKTANIIKSLEKSRDDYGKFKRNFISHLTELSNDISIKQSVDQILFEINQGTPKTAPYYFSDVLGYGACKQTDFTVQDYRVVKYPLASPFTLDTLSYKAVNVYVNGVQLIHERDYVFGTDGFVEILSPIKENDILTVYEYESTDGCYIPPTPTTLGLYPKFEPQKYLDTTLLEPKYLIQGHDGSVILAYNDYRDDIILELEKRIFNNIKVKYDTSILDIYDFIPGANRSTAYSLDEFNKILGPSFFKWTSLIDKDFTKSLIYSSNNAFTFNYSEAIGIDGSNIPAFWRGIYKFYFDTDRIHLTPWESLGFSIKPKWWDSTYGPAPYTSNNLILWQDLRDGVIKEPGKPVDRNSKFARPTLNIAPVDELGNLIDPILANLTQGIFDTNPNENYAFGDQSPVETAWRRSSYYPFSLLIAMILMQPNRVFAAYFDRSRIVKNDNNQLVYKDTNLRLRLSDVKTPNTVKDSSRTFTSGLINYIVEYLQGDNSSSLTTYKNDLKNINNKLSHRLAGFTSKEKYQLILDSKSSAAKAGVFVPNENYKIFLNSSSPTKKLSYSGVIVTKVKTKRGIGYVIKGYNQTNPYFYFYPWIQSGISLNVGGISESYIDWTPNQQYLVGNILFIDRNYYRVKVSHASQDNPSYDLLQKIPALPIVGGVTANLRKKWDRNPVILNYGTILNSAQEVVDFLQGHGEYLKDQGFEFDNFNPDLRNVASWDVSIKEFLFWTTQNWSSGSESYVEWMENTAYKLGTVVFYNGDYYRSKQDLAPSELFDVSKYFKLENLNSDGAAAISLSPAALQLKLNLAFNTVDDLREQNNAYEIFSSDGKAYPHNLLDYTRYDNTFTLTPKNENLGIYGATIYLVQKEHVLLIDNVTQFNDLIYNLETGYRQEKIQVSGYKTVNWDGSLDAPGFIYDRANIDDWTPWKDYHLGDIVKYKEFYYSAIKFLPGVENFDKNNWIKLDSKPTSELLPNWDYKALQFTDFYDLDSDNFDVGQQKMAQHLIGYQKRQYLENIIKNDVSEFKFYQGMIQEKGSINSLNKLFDVLSATDKDSIDFIEEWAIRVGQYGGKDAFDEVEFILDESLFKINPQAIELVTTINKSLLDFVIRQTKKDVYLRPKNYQNDLWSVNNNFNPFLRTPGFVKYDQVKFNTDKLDDLLNESPLNFVSGDYIWTAFEPKLNEFNDDWNVHRFTHMPYTTTALSFNNTNKDLTVTIDKTPNFTVGELIAIKTNYAKLNLFCKIKSINDKTIVLATTLDSYTPPTDIVQSTKLFKLTKQRFNIVDDLAVPFYLKTNELAWTNHTIDGKYAIWANNPVYNRNKIYRPNLDVNANFGKVIAISKSSNWLAITKSDNQVCIYYKPSVISDWAPFQVINSNVTDFGRSLAFSDDGYWLAISSISNGRGTISLFSLDDINHKYILKNASHLLVNPDLALSPDPYFGYKIKFAYDQGYSLVVSSTNGVNISGIIYYFKNYGDSSNWQHVDTISPIHAACENQPFAYDFDIDQTAQTLAVSTSLTHEDNGKVLIFQRNGEVFDKDQSMIYEITNSNYKNFGLAISLSEKSTYLAISGNLTDSAQQAVCIYKNYELFQTLSDRNKELDTNEKFGTYVKFVNDEKTLVVYSRLADSSSNSLFSYDDSTIIDSGRVDVYDRYANNFIYSESLSVETDGVDQYGYKVAAGDNNIVVSAPTAQNDRRSGAVYTHYRSDYSWKIVEKESPKIDLNLFKKIFLYNRRTNELLTYLDIVDIVQGKIPGIAEEQIKYKTYYDPATYSYSNSSSQLGINVDEGMSWLDNQVGTLWWDLRRAKFLDAHIGDVTYKNSTWNTLYESASIDIYEWVESKISPAEWDTLSKTTDGITQNVTGTSLYGDSAYSVKKKYDSVSKNFTSLYYFWVKNKTTVPNVNGRLNSALEISNIVSNPKGQGLKYIEFTNTNSVSLTNIKNLLTAKDVVLSVQYWLPNIDHSANIHSEWKIISENEKTEIPKQIERKWIDSLVGFDENGKMVPDLTLSPKQRYGIEFKLRQSMFVNRLEAIKQVVERFNSEFKKIQIDNIDLTDLVKKDLAPSEIFGLYDYVIDTEKELRFINVESFKKPSLKLNIENGKIVSVTVLDSGYGYKYAPVLTIVGAGINAKTQVILNASGGIQQVNILSQGEGYDKDNTGISLRALSVLVRSDSTIFGNWCIYTYTPSSAIWSKIKIQEYDVTNFWDYIDWYEDGYDQFTKIDYVVDSTYQLFIHDSKIGQVVKVNNVGSSGWLLLKKYSNVESIDYTQSFQVIGRQKGSIQLSNKFYNFKDNKLGYDSNLYDINKFDNSGSTELRIILNTLKDKILIDNRRMIYLNLFFLSVRYALSEQPFLDWIFKTSFVKALHNVGALKQKINYNNDNLEDYESYIAEVKPYRTKIREFVSVYNDMDNTQSLVTDFDLPSFVLNNEIIAAQTRVDNSLTYFSSIIDEYPWRLWRDNFTFSVNEIIVFDGGSGYLSRPIVDIVGDCTTPATARAYISKGRVTKIEVLSQGSGYYKAPTISIVGHLDVGGLQAKATAVIKNDLVRSNSMTLRFDRYAKEPIENILPLTKTETFTGNGSTISYDLIYSPNTEKGENSVTFTIDNIVVDAVKGSYSLVKTSKPSPDGSHTVHYGQIVFNSLPVKDPTKTFTLTVNYKKDFNHLKALDRIAYYYAPESGMIGRDFAQLMTGIDYGGVSIVGINFDPPEKWDSENNPWGAKIWDPRTANDDTRIYDALIEGGKFGKNGNIPYITASGLAAEDIIIDGDRFISPLTSPAPEEMLPGHVADTLVIKVSDTLINESADIVCDNYISDGATTSYNISQYPNSKSAVIVKVGVDILVPKIDYVVNYDDLSVKFVNAPSQGKAISIINMGFNGNSILEIDHRVISSPTKELVLDTTWANDLELMVLVSGEIVNFGIFKTDDSYKLKNKLGIKFTDELAIGQVVNYIIFKKSLNTSTSVVSRETLTTDGTTLKYELSNIIGKSLPLTQNTLVRVGNEILNSTDSFSFILKNNVYSYDIPLGKGGVDQTEVFDIIKDYKVYIDGNEVQIGKAYKIDLITQKVIILPNYYFENSKVLVTLVKYSDYEISLENSKCYINFKNSYPDNTKIEVISMYNHDVLNIQRSDYKPIANINNFESSIYYLEAIKIGGGILALNAPIINANYVWVIKNKTLLIPNLNYILSENKKEIVLDELPTADDVFSVLTFGSNVSKDPISFMQFKDILNRVHYKRLSKNRTTTLSKDLKFSDKEIELEDTTALGEPNIAINQPGVVYINGERIEYFIKNQNKISQLRRGTWGTGTPTVHNLGTEVFDIGANETVPYEDKTEIHEWEPNIDLPYFPSKDSVEVFVGGVRQRKNPYVLHNPHIHPESPQGDVDYPADFTIDENTARIQLNMIPRSGIRTQVVRKTLTVWEDPGKDIANSTNSIAYFLKFKPKKLNNG
jgi:hypothetical protein